MVADESGRFFFTIRVQISELKTVELEPSTVTFVLKFKCVIRVQRFTCKSTLFSYLQHHENDAVKQCAKLLLKPSAEHQTGNRSKCMICLQ